MLSVRASMHNQKRKGTWCNEDLVSSSALIHEVDKMTAWFFKLPVAWMAVVIFAITYLVSAAVFWSATRFWTNNRSHLPDRGILSPIGLVFGLLVVFTAAQVWGDLERASNSVTSE